MIPSAMSALVNSLLTLRKYKIEKMRMTGMRVRATRDINRSMENIIKKATTITKKNHISSLSWF